jgi:GTP-binding protein YchF
MRLGIIGLPGSGKTTVFNAVAGAQVAVGGYGQPDEIHRATVKIPDPRLEALFTFLQSKKKIHAEIEYFDFPPPARGAKDSENVFPPVLRECEGVAAVINCFDPAIEHSPRDRLRDLLGDMLVSDFILADKRRAKLAKESARGAKCDPVEIKAVNRAAELLEQETPLRTVEFSEPELSFLRGFAFLTLKPLLVVLNTAEGQDPSQQLAEQIAADPLMASRAAVTSLCGKVEMEVADLDDADRAAFLADFGITEPATDKLVRVSYDLLDLITFFTGAEKESRAWPVRRGATAPEAAGQIHQDFQRGFIRAEVVPVEKFVELGGMAACRKAALARLEGKDYIVNDGDYILFRFNV